MVTDSSEKTEILSKQFKSIFTVEYTSTIPVRGTSPYPSIHPVVFSLIFCFLAEGSTIDGPHLTDSKHYKEARKACSCWRLLMLLPHEALVLECVCIQFPLSCESHRLWYYLIVCEDVVFSAGQS